MIRKASAGDVSELVWFKSSYSDGPDGNSCVEIAIAPAPSTSVTPRPPCGPRLALTPAAWTRFLTYAADR